MAGAASRIEFVLDLADRLPECFQNLADSRVIEIIRAAVRQIAELAYRVEGILCPITRVAAPNLRTSIYEELDKYL